MPDGTCNQGYYTLKSRIEGDVLVITALASDAPRAGVVVNVDDVPGVSATTDAKGEARFDLRVEPLLHAVQTMNRPMPSFRISASYADGTRERDSAAIFESSVSKEADQARTAKIIEARRTEGIPPQVLAMSVAEARRITKARSATPPGPSAPADPVLDGISRRFCDSDEGDGEVCFNLGVYHSRENFTPGLYFETSCKLGFRAACERPELAQKRALDRRNDEQAAAMPDATCNDCSISKSDGCHRVCGMNGACAQKCFQYDLQCRNHNCPGF